MKFTKEIINAIKEFIIEKIQYHPNDISTIVMDHFGVSRPTASKYLNELVEDGIIVKTGNGRYPNYQYKDMHIMFERSLDDDLEEDIIWREELSSYFVKLPDNVREICQYGFTEMVNNVIDHSGGRRLRVNVTLNANKAELNILDDGIGIFNKIQADLGLEDPKHSILELAKGKFTSDPENHTGEGIFFSSRMFDSFMIISEELSFVGSSSDIPGRDWLFENEKIWKGTLVSMEITIKSKRKMIDVFNEYADPDKIPGFHKTTIPVKLMEYEGESLVSRSQAKRLILRFDHFLEVMLNFEGVSTIGQAFADQIFRVFANAHPDVHIIAVNTSEEIERMINYVKSNNRK
ncbi:MAG: DUF4325 domain-containing protein [Spirochaetales bacterium]|nr:DUF4325 domain-containing protein [Spirochaetales bacterium]